MSDAHEHEHEHETVVPRPSLRARAWAIARDNAYLALVGGAALVLLRVVDFSPPDKVRVADEAKLDMVGEAPRQSFSDDLGNSQAVQIRATLRSFDDVVTDDRDIASPDPELDDRARTLSQPVVTTILGMNAALDQTVRLDDGSLEVDVIVEATPRALQIRKSSGKDKEARVSLEHRVKVVSRRHGWWGRGEPEARTHLDTSGVLLGLDRAPHRVVFAVDDHLFALDVELNKP